MVTTLKDVLITLRHSVRKEGETNSNLFSIKEWESYSLERKKSIALFVAMTIPTQFIEDCSGFEFDKETQDFIKTYSPFDSVRDFFESMNNHDER